VTTWTLCFESSWSLFIPFLIFTSRPRADDLDFRWELFWGAIWKSMAFYVFAAEVWLAVESYLGLGQVSPRPLTSSKSKRRL
jgi:hypothetical protein